MPTIQYKDINFRPASLQMIMKCNEIIEQYQSQGFDLTLRQLYYQLVSLGIIANRQTEYDKLGSLINDARLAGHVDWDAIVDRTRNLRSLSHWNTPAEIMESAARGFNVDLWEGQQLAVEVWIEKDALIGVIEGVCQQLDVPHFSCRGYTSQSEMWVAGQRIINRFNDAGQGTIILHLGDHDPSGIDMTRDIQDRLELFCYHEDVPVPDVRRIALNSPQVKQYKPPPNPAKLTDSRAQDYIARYGDQSWELDALRPQVIVALIRDNVMATVDAAIFNKRIALQKSHRETLALAATKWPEIAKRLTNGKK